MRAYRLLVRPAEAASAVRTSIYIEKKVIGPKIKPFPRAGALNCLKVAELEFFASEGSSHSRKAHFTISQGGNGLRFQAARRVAADARRSGGSEQPKLE